MSGMGDEHSTSTGSKMSKQDHRNHFNKDAIFASDLWTDGLICAFEFVRHRRRTSESKYGSKSNSMNKREASFSKNSVRRSELNDVPIRNMSENILLDSTSLIEPQNTSPIIRTNEMTHLDDSKDSYSYCHEDFQGDGNFPESHWIPIGWSRISELVQKVQVDVDWASRPMEFADDEGDLTVADVAAPYWERPAGPTWWCHVAAGHPSISTWLSNAHWLHPAISVALRDEGRLISERMKHLLYEVPVRVAGGLLFELLGQSAGDPFTDEDDTPIVLRSWQAQNFLITALHIKGSPSNVNILGITEVQELLFVGGFRAPKSVHEVIAHLACRLSRWDDRLYRKYIFGASDEVELKFVLRRNQEDLNLLSVILNQEIRRLSTQVIRVKWSLHAREEIVFELLQHLRGAAARSLLEGIRKSTREMIEEQEAVRGRLFTIQDVMQGTVRAWLQDRSLRVTHNLAVFGGGGLVLSIITGLFGINVDGIPGADRTPYAFGLFAGILFFIGAVLIGLGLIYLGLKRPVTEEQVQVRKLELQKMVSMFQQDAEQHAKVRHAVSRNNLPPTAADVTPDEAEYILIR
ncbi:uncharacterized protein LOC131240773 [Magnolia sinica]|uniref:uncharacterized protein LOC131240773 n=1 Tax=Magnolia sinica TaxID=86752 RepID=UPI0026580D79|nr:uncharacterized protein LOC131240773 [Magnolia sinica]XP_058095210.1 uncharacterized protein LOC131240773 [Magnolia sinica]